MTFHRYAVLVLLVGCASQAKPAPARASAKPPRAGDAYLATVIDAIDSRWTLPKTIATAQLDGLSAEACLTIAADGTLTKFELVHKSGNSDFDGSLLRVMEKIRRLPTPPPRFAEAAARGRLCPTFSKGAQ